AQDEHEDRARTPRGRARIAVRRAPPQACGLVTVDVARMRTTQAHHGAKMAPDHEIWLKLTPHQLSAAPRLRNEGQRGAVPTQDCVQHVRTRSNECLTTDAGAGRGRGAQAHGCPPVPRYAGMRIKRRCSAGGKHPCACAGSTRDATASFAATRSMT